MYCYWCRLVADEKEWRKKTRGAWQIKQEYEVRFVKKAVETQLKRDEVLRRRQCKRDELLSLYGNKSTMSRSNSSM